MNFNPVEAFYRGYIWRLIATFRASNWDVYQGYLLEIKAPFDLSSSGFFVVALHRDFLCRLRVYRGVGTFISKGLCSVGANDLAHFYAMAIGP